MERQSANYSRLIIRHRSNRTFKKQTSDDRKCINRKGKIGKKNNIIVVKRPLNSIPWKSYCNFKIARTHLTSSTPIMWNLTLIKNQQTCYCAPEDKKLKKHRSQNKIQNCARIFTLFNCEPYYSKLRIRQRPLNNHTQIQSICTNRDRRFVNDAKLMCFRAKKTGRWQK